MKCAIVSLVFASLVCTTVSLVAGTSDSQRVAGDSSIKDIEALFAIEEFGPGWLNLIIDGFLSEDGKARIAAIKAAGLNAAELDAATAGFALVMCRRVIDQRRSKDPDIESVLATTAIQEILYSRRVIPPEQFIAEQREYLATMIQALRQSRMDPEIGGVFAFLFEALKDECMLLECLPDLTLVLRDSRATVKASLVNVLLVQLAGVSNDLVRREFLAWGRENLILLKDVQAELAASEQTPLIRDARTALKTRLIPKFQLAPKRLDE